MGSVAALKQVAYLKTSLKAVTFWQKLCVIQIDIGRPYIAASAMLSHYPVLFGSLIFQTFLPPPMVFRSPQLRLRLLALSLRRHPSYCHLSPPLSAKLPFKTSRGSAGALDWCGLERRLMQQKSIVAYFDDKTLPVPITKHFCSHRTRCCGLCNSFSI